MPAIRQDFELWRGTSPIIEISILKEDGTPEDISGWQGVLTFRTLASDPDPVKLSHAGAIYGAPANGKFRVPLTKAELLALAAGRYAFTFERTNSGSEDVTTWGIATLRLDMVNAA